MRLDRFLSEAGVASRRELKGIIKGGRVRVDGEVVKAPDRKLTGQESVTLDGKPVALRGPVVLMLHKPAGFVTSTEDPRDKTVMELLPEEYQNLFPVGRLDKDTEGLLLLTDDGDLGHRLTAPRYRVEKEYYAETEGLPDEADKAALAAGVTLRDGTVCLPAEMTPEEKGCRLVIREGKYHQVRRMLASLGHPVTYLRRVREGSLTLGDLPRGAWRALTQAEIGALRRETGGGG